MSWALKEQMKEIRAREQGEKLFVAAGRSPLALAYPNSYHVGMSNLGMHILYQTLNGRSDLSCERAFLPDAKLLTEHLRTKTPIMTLETQRELAKFELLGFAVSFEMDYFNILTQLQLSRIPLLASQRDEYDPLIIMGGKTPSHHHLNQTVRRGAGCIYSADGLSVAQHSHSVGDLHGLLELVRNEYYRGP